MKRYLAPLLILVILLLAGSSLWLRTAPVPAADVDSQPETVTTTQDMDSNGLEDPSDPVETDPETPAEPNESGAPAGDERDSDAALPSAETTPAGAVQSEPIPISELPSTPPYSAVPSAEAQTSSAQFPAAPPTEKEQAAETPAAAEPEPAPESQPTASVPDLSAMAQELLAEINRERSAAGVAPLTSDPSLSSVAQLRAQECTTQFGHIRPDGTTYRDAVADAGLSYRHLGENLASGHTTAKAVIQSWNNSDDHHDNMVSDAFTKAGIGLAENTNGKYHGYSWTVLFSD